jgi:hypothetical protein
VTSADGDMAALIAAAVQTQVKSSQPFSTEYPLETYRKIKQILHYIKLQIPTSGVHNQTAGKITFTNN